MHHQAMMEIEPCDSSQWQVSLKQADQWQIRVVYTVNDSVDYVNVHGEYYYLKKHLTPKQIQKYLYLQQMQIGVNIPYFSYEKGVILMQPGVTLFRLMCQNALSMQDRVSIFNQLEDIRLALKNLQVAHCDIKSSNVIVVPNQRGLKVYLIDCEYALCYGQRRICGTQDLNFNKHYPLRAITDEVTDDLGYHNIRLELGYY